MNLIVTRIVSAFALLCLSLAAMPGHASEPGVQHDLTLEIKPDRGEVYVKDRITLPAHEMEFLLTDEARALHWSESEIREQPARPGNRRFAVTAGDSRVIGLSYTLPLAPLGQGQAGSVADGIFWDGSGPWYADVPDRMHMFGLTVTAPETWRAVSQGARTRDETIDGKHLSRWREEQPQQEIYLIAAPFTESLRADDGIQLMVFLRQPDEELADLYLGLTSRYIGMYEDMIGSYPYAKFALVENTWESGYGMPSFTLLGPRVIRLPFIPYTSYPHEILHNWWGNSVYVDYDTGNWSEGLTSYLADHWIKERQGQGASYRRDALQKYLDFVSTQTDFSLTRFRGRHSEASQAVGYNKSLMVFHMLRNYLGDETFFEGLQRFYHDFKFQKAAFSDLQASFEAVGGRNLQWFFDQWVARTGAPELALDNVALVPRGDGVGVRSRLRQIQPGGVYRLDVPVVMNSEDGTRRYQIRLEGRELEFELALDEAPVSMTVDPEFDLFRKLEIGEVPPSLGAVFGSARLTFVIPNDASEKDRATYQDFIAPWREPGREVRTVTDDSPWPDSGAVWLLGWNNARRPLLERQLRAYGAVFSGDALELADGRFGRADADVVLAARSGENRPLLWAHLGTGANNLAQRLRHYGRMSYVAFEAGQPVVRGQWPVLDSPLTARFP